MKIPGGKIGIAHQTKRERALEVETKKAPPFFQMPDFQPVSALLDLSRFKHVLENINDSGGFKYNAGENDFVRRECRQTRYPKQQVWWYHNKIKGKQRILPRLWQSSIRSRWA
jgi:hypothetical protein